MAKNTQLTNLVVNTQADDLGTLCNAGIINIYTGTQPATADTGLSGNTLLVTLTFANPAFASASAGVIAANAIASGVAVATGTATFFRVFKSDTTTKVMDGSVGTTTANLILPTVSITSGQTISCSAFSHTVSKATAGD